MAKTAAINSVFVVIHKETGQYFVTYREKDKADTDKVLTTCLSRWSGHKRYKGPLLKNFALSYFTRHHKLAKRDFVCLMVRAEVFKERLREFINAVIVLLGQERCLNNHFDHVIDQQEHPATKLDISQIYSKNKPDISFAPLLPGETIHSCLKYNRFPAGMIITRRPGGDVITAW